MDKGKIHAQEHDAVFKEFFSDRDHAIVAMQQYLPARVIEKINFNTLTLHDVSTETFIHESFDGSGKMKRTASDLAFKFQFANHEDGFFLAHFEHQSKPDKTLPVRILQYQTSLLQKYNRHNPDNALPTIFTIVYYAGQSAYPYSLNIFDYFHDPELAKEFAFQGHLVDLAAMSDDEIERHGIISSYEATFKSVMQKNLDDKLPWIAMLMHEATPKHVNTLLKYLYSNTNDVKKEEFSRIIKESAPELEDNIMTLAQQLIDEGVQKGIQQGIQKGRLEGVEEGMHVSNTSKLIPPTN